MRGSGRNQTHCLLAILPSPCPLPGGERVFRAHLDQCAQTARHLLRFAKEKNRASSLALRRASCSNRRLETCSRRAPRSNREGSAAHGRATTHCTTPCSDREDLKFRSGIFRATLVVHKPSHRRSRGPFRAEAATQRSWVCRTATVPRSSTCTPARCGPQGVAATSSASREARTGPTSSRTARLRVPAGTVRSNSFGSAGGRSFDTSGPNEIAPFTR